MHPLYATTGPPQKDAVTFDELFAYAVRISGWLLGLWAGVTGRVQGAELVGLIVAFVGYEFVARRVSRQIRELGKHDEN